MSQIKYTLLRLLFLIILLTGTLRLSAQWELFENMIKNQLDTSGYVPYVYSDALEYNLMVASAQGYPAEIRRLIGKGADVNAETKEGATPLVFAVANMKTDAVTTLLEYGPVVDKVTSSYETPLMIAAKNDYFAIAEKLVRAGADVDFADRYGASPLHYAATYGYAALTDMLLYYDADVNKKTTDGSTPLHGAIWAGNTIITDILLQNGASVNEKDNDGMTPFLLASYFGDTISMELLRLKGADIHTLNNKGYNALSLAIMSEHKEATSYLLEKGKDWIAPENRTSDPYTIAAKYGRKDMLSLLREKNVPGKIKYSIDQMSVTLSTKFSLNDYYTGFTISFREPLLGIGFTGGFDTKLWYNRVLVKESENLFYQFWDKSSVAYAGVFKDFLVNEYPGGSNTVFTVSLNGGYSFGNTFKGSYRAPESKFRIIPGAALKWNISGLYLIAGLEYTGTYYAKTVPLWLRLGIGYTTYFDNVRIKIRPPKWY
jgi:ankyrin repeat protein